MEKLTPLASQHDGLGLEQNWVQQAKRYRIECVREPQKVCGSDAGGSAVGNFIGLAAPERKRKAGRPTSSRDKPPYDDLGAKSKKSKFLAHLDAAVYMSRTRAQEHNMSTAGWAPSKEKEKKPNAQYAEWEGIARTPASLQQSKDCLHVPQKATHERPVEMWLIWCITELPPFFPCMMIAHNLVVWNKLCIVSLGIVTMFPLVYV